MRILTVSLIVAGMLASAGLASADRRHHDRRDRWEQRGNARWHRPARRVIVAPVRVVPPRVIVRHRVQPRVIVVQPPPPPPPVYVIQPYPLPSAPVYAPPADPDCHDHDRYNDGYNGDYDGDGYVDGYSNYATPPQPSVSAGVSLRVGS